MATSDTTTTFTLCNGQKISNNRGIIEFEDQWSNYEMLCGSRKFAKRNGCRCYETVKIPKRPYCPLYKCKQIYCIYPQCRQYYGYPPRPFLKADFLRLNVCRMEYGRALTCGVPSSIIYLVISRMGKFCGKSMPSDVVQLITCFVDSNRKVYKLHDWEYRRCPDPKWTYSELLFDGRDVSKMLHTRCEWTSPKGNGTRFGLKKKSHSLYLESNGTVWEEKRDYRGRPWSRNPWKKLYFIRNKIVIKDIAMGAKKFVHCLFVDTEERVYSWGNNQYRQCRPENNCPGNVCIQEVTFPSLGTKERCRCISIQCGSRTSYAAFRMKAVDESGGDLYVDEHWMFGYNGENQCFTFDGRDIVGTPFCVNDIVKERFGGFGKIDSVMLDGDNTFVTIERVGRL